MDQESIDHPINHPNKKPKHTLDLNLPSLQSINHHNPIPHISIPVQTRSCNQNSHNNLILETPTSYSTAEELAEAIKNHHKGKGPLESPGRWVLDAIVRNTNGDVIAAATWSEHGTADPISAEARCIMLALKFAHQCCFRRIILETDCEKIVLAISDAKENYKGWGRMIVQIRKLLGQFQSSKVTHTRRICNKVAHLLAKQAHVDGNGCWLEEEPTFLRVQICKDLFHF